tara:strand:- start:830 stop:1183 length:354 start_codon:yes stop_codon:yes gene_type:complete
LLQENDLEYMRQVTPQAMPDVVDIQRRSLVSDKQGGYTEEWANAYQNVTARLASKGSSESVEENRRDVRAEFTLVLPYSQSILQADRIVHTSGTYEVQSVDAGKSWATSKSCQMRRL